MTPLAPPLPTLPTPLSLLVTSHITHITMRPWLGPIFFLYKTNFLIGLSVNHFVGEILHQFFLIFILGK